MAVLPRVLVWLCATALVAGLAARLPREGATVVDRQYVPGSLGRVRRLVSAAPPSVTRSGFLTRAMSGLERVEEVAWAARNGVTAPLAFSHNLSTVFPPRLARTRPELFPLADGGRLKPPEQPPYFWNPDLAREDAALFAAEAARRYFDAHPAEPAFALGVNDALIWGESPELLALVHPQRWFRERPDYSNVVFTFMNRAARHLSHQHPDKLLGALAYYWAEQAPSLPLHRQVVPFLTADRAQGYDPEFWREEADLQQRWARARASDGRLGLYDYVYGRGFLIPRIHLRLLADNLRHARAAGFTDYFAEVNPNWGLDGPQPWLLAQLLQDPSQRPDALLDEFYAEYFRECAGMMRRFFERCEAQWMRQPRPAYWLKHFRNESQAGIFPSEICRQLRAELNAATAAAVTPIVERRVRFVSRAFGVTERLVAFCELRNGLVRAALSHHADPAGIARLLADTLAARREFVRYTQTLRRSDPLAVQAFGWDDYLKNDPVPLALIALRAAGAGPEDSLDAPRVAQLWPGLMAAATAPGTEVLNNATMTGELRTPRTIAGLTYGVALPAEWTSRVEPAQFHQAELSGDSKMRTLRIRGTRDTTVSQWAPATHRGLHHASIRLRGRVSPGTAVSLVFAWLDEKHRHVGFRTVRLPDGDWAEWTSLHQADLPPLAARWVGLGLRVQNQVGDDWVEAHGFSVRAHP